MTDFGLTLTVLAAYVAVIIFLAVRDWRSHNAPSFAIGKRDVSSFPIMASVVGNLRDGAGVAAWIVLGIYFGFGALWLTLGLCIGLFVLGWLAPRIRKLAADKDYFSVNQMIRDRVGPLTERVSSIIIAATAFLYGAVQVNIAGSVFASLFGTHVVFGVILTIVIVGLYLSLGGFATSVRTGVFQWFIIMLIVLLPWIAQPSGWPIPSLESFMSPGAMVIVAFVGLSLLVTLSSSDLWQLIFSARSGRDGRSGLHWSMPMYVLISIGLVLFSSVVATAVGPEVEGQDAFFALFTVGVMPSFVVALIGVFVAASIMSTLDSQVFLFSSTIVGQFRPESKTDDPATERKLRAVIVVTMIALALLALTITDIIQFLFGAVTLATVLVPVLIVASIGREHGINDKACAFGLIVASMVYAYLFLNGLFDNLIMTLLPAAISIAIIAVILAVSAWSRIKKPDR
ncbi:MAG: hypothetical protein IH944_13820 [Armatimonadetes bacterium]|nr:hypothetical protein [Armatimonadota bacterium]